MKTILNTLGLEEERVWIRWISAAEGVKFARTISEFTSAIKKLGPNPIKNNWSV